MKICIHIEEENLYNCLNKLVYKYYRTKLKAFVVIKGVTDLLSQQVMSVQSQVHHFGNLCSLHYQELMNLNSLKFNSLVVNLNAPQTPHLLSKVRHWAFSL